MVTYKAIWLFLQQSFLQLKRKWLSLPLLFLFPIIIVSLIAILLISLFTFTENKDIYIAIVDLDKSTETEAVVQLMEEGSQFGEFIRITTMSEKEANKAINNNELSAYIIFPENFTSNLYEGKSTELALVGNPNKQIESLLIREIIDSVIRHIRASQASILAINYFAKELGINDDARNELIFEQFKEFVFYTLSSKKVIRESEITSDVTATPADYFVTASIFLILTLWLFINFNLLYKQIHDSLKQRIRLYGVTEFQQISAKIFVALITSLLFMIVLFIGIQSFFHFDIQSAEILNITLVILLYSFIILFCLALIEVLFQALKIRILIQSMFVLLTIVLSGAIIPTIYFPIWFENGVHRLFFTETFNLLLDIVLHQRLYLDTNSLLLQVFIALFLLMIISNWKERRK